MKIIPQISVDIFYADKLVYYNNKYLHWIKSPKTFSLNT